VAKTTKNNCAHPYLEVIANCPSAEEDMNVLTRIKGYELVRKWKEDEQNHFLIKKV